jgi:hypothetical protein
MGHDRKRISLMLLSNEVRHSIRVLRLPVFVGTADIDYSCGACGATLCAGMREGDLAGLAFTCTCGASNLVPLAAETGPAPPQARAAS